MRCWHPSHNNSLHDCQIFRQSERINYEKHSIMIWRLHKRKIMCGTGIKDSTFRASRTSCIDTMKIIYTMRSQTAFVTG